MIGGILAIGSSIVSGITDYFKGKQEIKKVQVEADMQIIKAEADAKAAEEAANAEPVAEETTEETPAAEAEGTEAEA